MCTKLLLSAAVLLSIAVSAPQAAQPAAQPLESATVDLTTPMSSDDIRHLLARTGLGAAPADALALRGKTHQQGIDYIMDGFEQQPSQLMPAWTRAPVPHYHAREDMSDNERALFNNERDAELAQLRQWWTIEMLLTSSPQTERMVLFWHDVFATSYYDTDRQALAMARQNQSFRQLAMGSWETLLQAMIRDAALLEFLDSGSNHKKSPNENLAREFLELFTLGENNYDENTVREAARSLTGHDTTRLHDLQFRLKTWKQDRGSKTLFGQTGPHTGNDLIRIVLEQPAAARFMATRFWQAFISDTPADAAWVNKMAQTFRASDYHIATLYQAVLESDAFWDPQHRGMLVKSPIDLLIGTARTLEYPKHQWRTLVSAQSSLGMELFAPPNVSGWKEGSAFITPGRLLERYSLMDTLLSDDIKPPGSGGAAMRDMQSMSMAGTEEGATSKEAERLRATAPLQLRLAAEDYQGPVRYQISLFRNGELLWQGPELQFAQGHDTQRYGRINNESELNWSMQRFTMPERQLQAADRLDVAFLNDAAGSDGDRNFYVDGLMLDDRWFSGSRAKQQSECPPELPANSWKLYCDGRLQFRIARQSDMGSDAPTDASPAWHASAVHIQWANTDRHGHQTAYLTLDDLQAGDRSYHSVQFSIVNRKKLAPQLRVESFGCWPSCIESRPDCEWTDTHFPRNRTAAFLWVDLQGAERSTESTCSLDALSDHEQQLVSALWRSVPSLLRQVRKTNRGKRFLPVLDALEKAMEHRSVHLSDTPYGNAGGVIEINAAHAPAPSVRETITAPEAAITGADELLAQLDSVDLSIHQLLLPTIDVSGLPQSLPAGSAKEQLRDLAQNPLFQLK